jgi:hypothetical protein
VSTPSAKPLAAAGKADVGGHGDHPEPNSGYLLTVLILDIGALQSPNACRVIRDGVGIWVTSTTGAAPSFIHSLGRLLFHALPLRGRDAKLHLSVEIA